MREGRRLGAAVVAVVVLGACGGPPVDEPEPEPAAAVAAPPAPDAEAAEPPADVDPVATWIEEAGTRFAAGDAAATTRFLHGSMHPSLRSEFRWCDTAWFGDLDWSQPATWDVDAGPEPVAWTGEVGPLAGEVLDDAQQLEAVLESDGQRTTVTVPFVVAGSHLHWLADCPAAPEPAADPEPPSGQQATAPDPSPDGSSAGRGTQGGAAPAPDAQAHRLTGTVTVLATMRPREYADDDCWTTGGFSDIGPGTQVRIEDGSGELLALSRLGAPYERPTAGSDGQYVTCHWDFGPVDVGRSDFYTVTVSHRGGPTMTYQELVADGWDTYLYFGS